MPKQLGHGKYLWLVVWYCGTEQDRRYESCSVINTKVAKNPRPELKEILTKFVQKTYALPTTTNVVIDVIKPFNAHSGGVCTTVTL